MKNAEPIEQATLNENDSTNPANWSGWFGEIYFSKSDNRWFLRRRKRWMGWAVNFAHPLGVLYLYLSTGLLVLFGVIGITVGIVAASWKISIPPPPGDHAYPQLEMNEWIYPKSNQVSSSGNISSYSVAEQIESVWLHYAKLLGIEGEFGPGGVNGGTTYSPGGGVGGSTELTGNMNAFGANGLTTLSYEMGAPNREEVRTATFLIHNQPGYALTIFLSSGKGEGKTYITLVARH